MKSTFRNTLAAAACALLALPVCAQTEATKEATAAAPAGDARTAPDFSLKDADGKEHKLADFKGKPVVLVWINPGTVDGTDLKSGCPFITDRVKQGSFEKMAADVKAKDGVFLAVNSTSSNDAAASKKVAETFKQTYPVLLDTEGTVGSAYQAKTTPHAFVINADGKIVYEGAINDNDSPDPSKDASAKNYVALAVDAAKKGEAPAVTKTKPYGCGVKYKK